MNNPTVSSQIVLPTNNPSRIVQLEKKLQEYKNRVREFLSTNHARYMAPEMMEEALGSTNYKIEVMERLFRDGRIDTLEFSKELQKEMEQAGKSFNAYWFDNAAAIIKDYVTTGGQNVRGGTGLHN